MTVSLPLGAAGSHVSLRKVEETDRKRIFAWRNSADVAPFMYSDHEISQSEHDRWYDALIADDDRLYWVVSLNGEPVGLANFADLDFKNKRCAWAYYLADPSVRGRGVGSFVEFWMIEYAFNVLNLQKLWCEVILTNEAVWRLHMTHGFQREALFRGHVVKAGTPVDVVGLGLLAEDWRAIRPAARERLIDKGYATETLDTPIPD